MREATKVTLIYISALLLLVFMAVGLAKAEQTSDIVQVEVVEDDDINDDGEQTIDQAELDRMLAPIALYPDSLLSHILVASTYPLEIIKATRWRLANEDLSEQEALDAIEDKDWDPSVKALVPLTDLLKKLSDDLAWLQDLGDAFLLNEDQVLSSVQALRRKAYDQGSLEDSEYIEVVEEDDDIVIQSTQREIVYVPYYDTRVVYGTWWWHDHQPIYWHRPANYYLHAGFYWSPRYYVRNSYFLGGFHWGTRHLVVNHHYYNHPRRHHNEYRHVRVNEYQRWSHNPSHRRGVRYRHSLNKGNYQHNYMRPPKTANSREYIANNKVRTVNAEQTKRRLSNQSYGQPKKDGVTNRYRDQAKRQTQNASSNHKRRDVVNQPNRTRSDTPSANNKVRPQQTNKSRTTQKTKSYRQTTSNNRSSTKQRSQQQRSSRPATRPATRSSSNQRSTKVRTTKQRK